MTSSGEAPAPVSAHHDPSAVRPSIVGSAEAIEAPYPIYLQGWVERGFGRGSKELGCPTANLPDSAIEPYASLLRTGVHYGFAIVHPNPSLVPYTSDDTELKGLGEVLPMVMSVGWNPFYKNTRRTAEVHILRPFDKDFYGQELRVVVLGYIRPELNYAGMDALIKDINHDKLVSLNSLDRPIYQSYTADPFFLRPSDLPTFDPSVMDRKIAPLAPEEVVDAGEGVEGEGKEGKL